MRQVIENVHHNTMTDWDTSKAIEKLLSLSPGDSKLIKTGSGGHNDRGETWLSEKIGKSRGYIIEHLELLESSEAFQKAVKEDRINFTLNRAIKQTPDEFKVAMEEKILNNEFASRDGAIALAKALKDNPNHSRQLLKTNYSDCKNSDQIKEKIRQKMPLWRKCCAFCFRVEDQVFFFKQFLDFVDGFVDLLFSLGTYANELACTEY